LARRLVDVDLLSQAADLLKYQADNRLDGVPRAEVATDLAVIDLMDRRPEAALDAINTSRTHPPAHLPQRPAPAGRGPRLAAAWANTTTPWKSCESRQDRSDSRRHPRRGLLEEARLARRGRRCSRSMLGDRWKTAPRSVPTTRNRS
jgi:hypothetical protein